MKVHTKPITALNFNNDGSMIVCGSRDCKISVILTTEEKGYFKLSGHNGPITQVKFFDINDKLFATSSLDNSVKFWDIESKSCIFTLPSINDSIWDFNFCNNDTNLILGTASKDLLIFNIEKESETGYLQLTNPFSIIREAKKRVMSIKSLSNGKIIIVQVILLFFLDFIRNF